MLQDSVNNETNPTVQQEEPRVVDRVDVRQPPVGDQSLLRFSTENILPAWLPFPTFAFEVVRRNTTMTEAGNQGNAAEGDGNWQRFFRRGGQVPVEAPEDADTDNLRAAVQDGQQPTIWRLIGRLIGIIPMSPEEEAAALEQLIDMFPQYDRADLLRELRTRRSSEAVAEAILLGLFSGTPRGGAE